MLSLVRLSSVCRLSVCLSSVCVCCLSSVTLVHPTQLVEVFRNVSSPFGTLATRWHWWKILPRSSQGNPSGGRVKRIRGVVKYSDFWPIEGYISKWCKIGRKLVLITNRKSHTSFRLVPKSKVQSYSPGGGNVSSHKGTLAPPGEYDWTFDFGTNRKLVCDFLLVINTNLRPILHHLEI